MTSDQNNRIQWLFAQALDVPVNERTAWLESRCANEPDLLAELVSLLTEVDRSHDPLERGLEPSFDKLLPTISGEQIWPTCSLALAQFLARLEKLGVVSTEEYSSNSTRSTAPESELDPRQIALELVGKRKITSYQAQALLRGTPELLIDKYLIVDLVDSGGMGIVFKAIHRPMHRIVALKMIAGDLLNSPQQMKRFQREVRVAATLEHPNIVRAYDADQAGEAYFLVMEYVRGMNLAKYVARQGPISTQQAIHYIMQAAKGLSYAHQRGIIHRDIKPGNLMLDEDSTVKILDLGLASVNPRIAQAHRIQQESTYRLGDPETNTELTQAGVALGTVSFMAPEQAKDAAAADHRSDIYSLGCTLYFLLVGEPPFRGATPFDTVLQHLGSAPPKLRGARPDVALETESCYRKMLAKAPEKRFQSMDELISTLETLIDSNFDQAIRPENTSLAQAEVPSKSYRQAWLVAISILAFVLGGFAVYKTFHGPASSAQNSSLLGNALSSQRADDVVVPDETNLSVRVEKVAPPAPQVLSTKGLESLKAASFPEIRFDAPVYSLCFSPDANDLYAAGLRIRDDAFAVRIALDRQQFTTVVTPLTGLHASVSAVVVSPLGAEKLNIFASAHDGFLYQYQTDQAVFKRMEVFDAGLTSLDLVGDTIVTCSKSGSLYLLHPASASGNVRKLPGDAVWMHDIVAGPLRDLPAADAPRKTCFYTAGREGVIRRWNAETGALLASSTPLENWVNSLAYDHFLDRLVVAVADGRIMIYDPHSLQAKETFHLHVKPASVSVSPANGEIAVSGDSMIIHLISHQDSRIWALPLGENPVTPCVCYSPDGNLIATGGYANSGGQGSRVRVFDRQQLVLDPL